MVGARRVGTAVAVCAISQSIAVIVLVVAAFCFRHDGTIGSRPSGSAFASELVRLQQAVDSASDFAALQANAAVVAAIARTAVESAMASVPSAGADASSVDALAVLATTRIARRRH